MHTKFWLEILKRRDHFRDLGIDRSIIPVIKTDPREMGYVWSRFI
jgi:hypothetical protein